MSLANKTKNASYSFAWKKCSRRFQREKFPLLLQSAFISMPIWDFRVVDEHFVQAETLWMRISVKLSIPEAQGLCWTRLFKIYTLFRCVRFRLGSSSTHQKCLLPKFISLRLVTQFVSAHSSFLVAQQRHPPLCNLRDWRLFVIRRRNFRISERLAKQNTCTSKYHSSSSNLLGTIVIWAFEESKLFSLQHNTTFSSVFLFAAGYLNPFHCTEKSKPVESANQRMSDVLRCLVSDWLDLELACLFHWRSCL